MERREENQSAHDTLESAPIWNEKNAALALLGLVFRKLRGNLVEIDRDLILELGSLYLCLVSQLEIRKLQKILAEEKLPRYCFFHSII